MGLSRFALAFVATGFGIAAIVACSEPPGVDACRAIEDVRCRAWTACGNSFTALVDRNGTDIDSCIAYYEDECKHGLASGANPSGSQINACVNSIASSCDYVTTPTDSPACTFLIPPVTSTDAGTDSETSTDATADGDATAD